MWPNPKETSDLVIFTEEIHNGNLHFLRSEISVTWNHGSIICSMQFKNNYCQFHVIITDSNLINKNSNCLEKDLQNTRPLKLVVTVLGWWGTADYLLVSKILNSSRKSNLIGLSLAPIKTRNMNTNFLHDTLQQLKYVMRGTQRAS